MTIPDYDEGYRKPTPAPQSEVEEHYCRRCEEIQDYCFCKDGFQWYPDEQPGAAVGTDELIRDLDIMGDLEVFNVSMRVVKDRIESQRDKIEGAKLQLEMWLYNPLGVSHQDLCSLTEEIIKQLERE